MQVHETNDGWLPINRNNKARLDYSSQHLLIKMCYSLIGVKPCYTPHGADDVSQGRSTIVSDGRGILVCNEAF